MKKINLKIDFLISMTNYTQIKNKSILGADFRKIKGYYEY